MLKTHVYMFFYGKRGVPVMEVAATTVTTGAAKKREDLAAADESQTKNKKQDMG